MAQYVDTIKVLFPKFLLACFMGMQTWRQERQKTNKFTMGTSRQMTTLPHKTNPEAHTMLEGQIVSVPPVHLHEYQFQKCCERRK